MRNKCLVGMWVFGLVLSWSAAVMADGWYETISGARRWTLVLNGEAVLDNETGIVWQRDTIAFPVMWLAGDLYCHRVERGGRKGWRLPTIDELSSLVDSSQLSPSLPKGHRFTNTVPANYWSSTTGVGNPEDAWLVDFHGGNVTWGNKNDLNYVRCVRGGP